MPKTPRVVTNVINLTDVPTTPVGGVHFVMGPTERGEFAKPNDLITSWAAYQRLYGGLLDDNDFPLICKRALDKGAYLRVSRVGHYTDITDKDTLSATKADESNTGRFSIVGQFTAGNTFNVTINGVAISQVSFVTDHATTMQAIATELESHAAVLTATVGEGDQTIFITSTSPVAVTGLTLAGPTGSFSLGLEVVNKTGEVLFTIEPKGEGAGYNGMVVALNKTGGSANYFTLSVNVGSVEETFNLTLLGKTVAGNLIVDDDNTVAGINTSSNLIQIVGLNTNKPYTEISGLEVSHTLFNGTDGNAIVDADYTGDSGAKTGFYAFDSQSDGSTLSTLGHYDIEVHIAGASYASTRKDVVYLAELNPTVKTASAIKAARETITGTDKYSMVYAGGLKIQHPTTGVTLETAGLGDVLANISVVHTTIGPWASFANTKGVIQNALGVVNDFGSSAQYGDRNLLAMSQVNLLIKKGTSIMQWGNFTGQEANNVESFASTVFTVIYLRKLLEPILETFVEEPADIPTFKRIYLSVKDTLDSLKGSAYYDYRWDGDQDAKSIDKVQVNTPSALQQGLYKINFYIKTITPIQEIKVNIVLTSAGVSFDESETLI